MRPRELRLSKVREPGSVFTYVSLLKLLFETADQPLRGETQSLKRQGPQESFPGARNRPRREKKGKGSERGG